MMRFGNFSEARSIAPPDVSKSRAERCSALRYQWRRCCHAVAALVFVAFTWSAAATDFHAAPAIFNGVLKQFVKDARVDYAGLKAQPGELNRYLETLAQIPPAEFEQWPENERLACLINLYNATTLKLIVDNYPLKSIRNLGVLPGAAWREFTVRFGGQLLTLDHLENKIIRVNYHEPRIHFALVCAALGCPPLRSEAYTGARLNEQLDDQARQFFNQPEKNRFDAAKNTLYLSPIFKWYEADFTKPAGSLAAYAKTFLPEAQRAALTEVDKVKVRFTDYDWALNEPPK